MVQTIHHLLSGIPLGDLLHMTGYINTTYRSREDIDNESIINHNGVVFVQDILRNNRENPSGVNDHTNTLHVVGLRKVTEIKTIVE